MLSAIIGQTLAVITAACFATVSTCWSYVGKKIGSNTVTHIRLWLALPQMMLVHYLFTGYWLPFHMSSHAVLLFAVSGLFGFAIADLFIFRSLILLGVRETLVILTLSPIMGAVISWFALSEQLTHLQILGIMVTVGGVMWVIYEEGKNRVKTDMKWNKGIPFALAGALAQALANILSKGALLGDVHPISGSFLRLIAGLTALIIFSTMRGQLFHDFRQLKYIRLTAILTAAAFIGPVVGVIISLYALTLAPVGIVTALIQVSPVLLLPFDHFVLKKQITRKVVAGTIITIIGAAILFIY